MLTLKLKLKIKQRVFDDSVNKAESELVRMWYSASRENLAANGAGERSTNNNSAAESRLNLPEEPQAVT